MRILVVEDEVKLAANVCAGLREVGFCPDHAPALADARTLAATVQRGCPKRESLGGLGRGFELRCVVSSKAKVSQRGRHINKMGSSRLSDT